MAISNTQKIIDSLYDPKEGSRRAKESRGNKARQAKQDRRRLLNLV